MRAKIILPNLLAVLLVGLVGFFYLKYDLNQKAIDKLRGRLESARVLVDYSAAVGGYELLQNVSHFAKTKVARDAFAPVDIPQAPGQTQEQYDKILGATWSDKCVAAVTVYSDEWTERTGKRPELVFVTDRKGVVIARNTTPNACPAGKNVSDAIAVARRALDGESTYALWSVVDSKFSAKKPDPKYCQLMNTGLLEMAASPIWYEDEIKGALVLGLEVSNGAAKKKAEMLGAGIDLAVIENGTVYSSSLEGDGARQSLESALAAPELSAKLSAAIAEKKPSDIFQINVAGRPYLAVISPASNAEPSDRLVNVVLASIDEATAHLSVLNVLLMVMCVALLAVLIVGFVLGNHFLKPVYAIEEGLLRVINGETQYRLDIKSSELGGLGYRINQLVGALTGEQETPEEEA